MVSYYYQQSLDLFLIIEPLRTIFVNILLFFSILILGLPEQDNLVKDLKNKLKQENQENAKLNNEMSKKDTMINQLKEKLQIADCQRYLFINNYFL